MKIHFYNSRASQVLYGSEVPVKTSYSVVIWIINWELFYDVDNAFDQNFSAARSSGIFSS